MKWRGQQGWRETGNDACRRPQGSLQGCQGRRLAKVLAEAGVESAGDRIWGSAGAGGQLEGGAAVGETQEKVHICSREMTLLEGRGCSPRSLRQVKEGAGKASAPGALLTSEPPIGGDWHR